MLIKMFPQIKDRFARWTVFELSIEEISQLLIKLWGLKVRGRNTGVVATPLTCFALCFLHEPLAKTMSAIRLIYPDDADFKPLGNRMRSSYQSAKSRSGSFDQEEKPVTVKGQRVQ
jgi:hypothetical protein